MRLQQNTAGPAVPAVRVRGLVKRFPQQPLFDGLDLDIEAGAITGLVGASGTGKSVLLRMLVGLERPQGGSIEIDGRSIAKMSATERLSTKTARGVLFQDGALFGALTVLQNVEVPLREHTNLNSRLIRELARSKLAMVGLSEDAAEKLPAELSGGMRKRAGLARALALEPEIVFLDEPTAGLDPIGADGFDQLIVRLQDALGLTVVMVTHDLDSIFAVCDQVAVLSGGRIVRSGKPDDLRRVPGHPWVQAYFCGARAESRGFGALGRT